MFRIFEQNLDGKHNLSIECLHVHSGETIYDSTLKTDHIVRWRNNVMQTGENRIIFTTYHSLHRVVESGILIDTIYFDEAHNGTAKNFYSYEQLSQDPELVSFSLLLHLKYPEVREVQTESEGCAIVRYMVQY